MEIWRTVRDACVTDDVYVLAQQQSWVDIAIGYRHEAILVRVANVDDNQADSWKMNKCSI
eukprot:scaffold2067_cov101-Cylindrotheca_fusiformis.AAC.2